MGLARLGILVNFVSGAVVVGFTAGAGILIFVNQLRTLLRLNILSSPRLDQTIVNLVTHVTETHWPSLLIGGGTIILVLFLRRASRKLPAPLISMVIAALADGESRLLNPLVAGDSELMAEALQRLGFGVRREPGAWTVRGGGGKIPVMHGNAERTDYGWFVFQGPDGREYSYPDEKD